MAQLLRVLAVVLTEDPGMGLVPTSGGSQLPVMPFLGYLMPFFTSMVTYTYVIHRYTLRHTYTHKIISKYFKNKMKEKCFYLKHIWNFIMLNLRSRAKGGETGG